MSGSDRFLFALSLATAFVAGGVVAALTDRPEPPTLAYLGGVNDGQVQIRRIEGHEPTLHRRAEWCEEFATAARKKFPSDVNEAWSELKDDSK